MSLARNVTSACTDTGSPLLLCRPQVQLIDPQIRRHLAQPQVRLAHALGTHRLPLADALVLVGRLVLDTAVGDGVNHVHAVPGVLLAQTLGDHTHGAPPGTVGVELGIGAHGAQGPGVDDGALLVRVRGREGGLAAVLGVEELERLLAEREGPGGVGGHVALKLLRGGLQIRLLQGMLHVEDGELQLQVLEVWVLADLGKGPLQIRGAGVARERVEDPAVGTLPERCA